MPTAQQILAELKPLGSAGYRKVMANHGVKDPCYGVKISDLKVIQKRIQKDYRLALDLYDTGVYDAMYLAGLIADDAKMTRRDLENWVRKAGGGPLMGSTVPWVAAGSSHGWELALEWIDSVDPEIAGAGWATLGAIVSITADAALEMAALKKLLKRVERDMPKAADRTRYQMNGFVIAVGCYVAPLTEAAIATAEKIGRVRADLGQNACEVPYAPEHIAKVQQRGTIGKKRKSAKC